jgi:hypothetical protein
MLEPKVGDVVRFVPNDGTLGSVVIDVNGADRDIVWLVIKSRPHQERGDMRSLGPEDVNRAFVVEQIEPKGWAINRRTRKRRSVMMCPLGGEDSRRVLINEEDIASGQVDFPSIHDEKFYFGLGDRVVVNRGDQFRYLYAVQRATAAEVIRGRRTSEKE